ncbi:MAG: hypothetical protein JO097_02425 [Acidobacteriaceae bacterium]|nr:hypothetical protein [Acidobacteriaceae bacterium]MBV9301194.1 hypothetical protein [Acidobacteriaceae bacterium]
MHHFRRLPSLQAIAIKFGLNSELEALTDTVCALRRKILALSDKPAECKKSKAYKDQWPICAGDWRVIYTIDDAHNNAYHVERYVSPSATVAALPQRLAWSCLVAIHLAPV